MCTNPFQRLLHPMQGLLALAMALLAGSAVAQSVLPLPTGVRNVAGTVRAILVQADGRVVLGGSFTAVDGIARSNLARLNADGSVDLGWNPGTDGSVLSLAATATTIYVGGFFDHAGGQPRASIAAVDSASGAVLDWNPGMPSTIANFVLALATDGATVYAGGAFQAMGGETRANLAAIDAVSGTALPWNPSVLGAFTANVNALVVTGGKVIIGGVFEEVGGQSHKLLASIDASTGVV
ncbi:MAG TPA: delta-60 repeat domain-containing protein, partial [Dokdonella sp.]|nr:delta-60 repeat domain-containing protein [Dokdonella sp.]